MLHHQVPLFTAIHHAPPGTVLQLHVWRQGAVLQLSVTTTSFDPAFDWPIEYEVHAHPLKTPRC